MDPMDAVAMVEDLLRRKWSLYANREAVKRGQLHYFVVSRDLNDRLVLFMYGADRKDARLRLEGALRLLGCDRLYEFDAGDVDGRLQVPLCPRDGSILEPLEPWLFGLLSRFRCGARGCHHRSWSFGLGARPGPRPSMLESGGSLDIKP